MHRVFRFDSYKDFLFDLVSGERGYRGLRTELAKAMGCQAAYLTQVLKAKADLTEVHGLRLAKYLKFSRMEAEYFLLLIREAKASSPDLKNYLKEDRERLRGEAQDLKHRSDSKTIAENETFITRYFVDWVPSTLHVATSSENYQTVKALAQRFNLPTERVAAELDWLEEQGLVQKIGSQRWRFSGTSIHLPSASPLDFIHQISRRCQAIESIQRKKHRSDIHFSSLFTLDGNGYKKLGRILAESIENAQKHIHSGGTEEVFGFCVDLFQVV